MLFSEMVKCCLLPSSPNGPYSHDNYTSTFAHATNTFYILYTWMHIRIITIWVISKNIMCGRVIRNNLLDLSNNKQPIKYTVLFIAITKYLACPSISLIARVANTRIVSRKVYTAST